MKRRRDGTLTGGTGDVSPQWMSFVATQSAADTTTTTTQAIPVQRLPTGGKAQVMEVLKVWFASTQLPASASAAETTDLLECFLSTSSFGTTNTSLSEPRVFAADGISSRSAFTAAGTYFSQLQPSVRQYDLTDGAGHGVLIATDNIFAQVSSTATGNTNLFRIKILYRWKNIPLQEYIGIVASQQ